MTTEKSSLLSCLQTRYSREKICPFPSKKKLVYVNLDEAAFVSVVVDLVHDARRCFYCVLVDVPECMLL